MEWSLNLPEQLNSALWINGLHERIVDPKWRFPLHSHPTFELLHCVQGHALTHVNGAPIRIESGDSLFLRPGDIHDFLNDTDSSCTYFTFHFDIDDARIRRQLFHKMESLIRRDEMMALHLSLQEQIHTLLHLIGGAVEGGECGDSRVVDDLDPIVGLRIYSCIFDLLASVAAIHRERAERAAILPNTSLSFDQRDLAARMAAEFQQDINSGLRIQDVAQQFNISLSHCNRIFHEAYGMSPRRYLSQIILQEAKRLLIESEFTVEEVAGRLGFHSTSHFCRQFKRWMGVSPTHFRKKA